jgi:hypothetical protein
MEGCLNTSLDRPAVTGARPVLDMRFNEIAENLSSNEH